MSFKGDIWRFLVSFKGVHLEVFGELQGDTVGGFW